MAKVIYYECASNTFVKLYEILINLAAINLAATRRRKRPSIFGKTLLTLASSGHCNLRTNTLLVCYKCINNNNLTSEQQWTLYAIVLLCMYTIIQVFKDTFPGEIAGKFPVSVQNRLGLPWITGIQQAGRLIDVPTNQLTAVNRERRYLPAFFSHGNMNIYMALRPPTPYYESNFFFLN